MACIYYGVAGEGRGHAGRAFALIEALRREHDVVVYSSGQAHDMLSSRYSDASNPSEATQTRGVELRRVPGLNFRYDQHRRLDYTRTFLENIPYLAHMRGRSEDLAVRMRREQPALVLTDFEPLLPRAAFRAEIPVVSIDHQHFLTVSDLTGLPRHLQRYARLMAPFVRRFCPVPATKIVSSFFFPPLRPSAKDVLQVGVLLRPEILSTKPREGHHLVAYLRRDSSHTAVGALVRTGLEIRVYGLGERPAQGHVQFRPVHPVRFVDDLASCRALITTAGNQLVGESLYFGKPVLAMPERGNYEQEINGYFLAQSGAGTSIAVDSLTPGDVHRFLTRLESYRARIDRDRLAGNQPALDRIQSVLRRATQETDARLSTSVKEVRVTTEKTEDIACNVSSASVGRYGAIAEGATMTPDI